MATSPPVQGEVRRSRSRLTGTIVILLGPEQEWLDPAGGKWLTLCSDHGTVCNYETRSVAESFMPWPHNWCEECQGYVDRFSLTEELQDISGRCLIAEAKAHKQQMRDVEAHVEDARRSIVQACRLIEPLIEIPAELRDPDEGGN